LAWVAG